MAKSACTKPTEDLRVQRHEAIWLDGRVPNGYWDRPENRRLYVRWLGRQLGIRRPADWYRVTVQDFKDHKGGAFLIHYNSTVSAAIKAFLPDYDWKEWMFHMAPLGFWQERKNRRNFRTNYGASPLARYRSYHDLVKECAPSA